MVKTKVDLHIHTTKSDGVDTPAQIVEKAKDLGMYAIAITDHDTLAGVEEALEAGRRQDLQVLPACEISAGGVSEVHVLGYGLRPGCGIDGLLEEMAADRVSRMEQMLARLRGLGIDIAFESIKGYTTGCLGRAHLARALMEGGHVASIKEAFDKYLSPTGAAYVARKKMDTRNVISLIRDCGGVPVVAHPGRGRVDTFWLEECLRAWKKRGLMGVEAYHPAHGLTMAHALDRMARRNGLLVTGGSDYHGSTKTQRIGDGMNGWTRVEQDFQALTAAINSLKQ